VGTVSEWLVVVFNNSELLILKSQSMQRDAVADVPGLLAQLRRLDDTNVTPISESGQGLA
jgi:hypothetical protein